MSRLFIDTPYLVFENHETQNDAPLEASRARSGDPAELARSYAEIAADPVNARAAEGMAAIERPGAVPAAGLDERDLLERDERGRRAHAADGRRGMPAHRDRSCAAPSTSGDHMQGDMVVEPPFPAPVHPAQQRIRGPGPGGRAWRPRRTGRSPRAISTTSSPPTRTWRRSGSGHRGRRGSAPRRSTSSTRAFSRASSPWRRAGCTGFWFAPWDDIVFWMGADNLLLGAGRQARVHASPSSAAQRGVSERSAPVRGARAARAQRHRTCASGRADTDTAGTCPALIGKPSEQAAVPQPPAPRSSGVPPRRRFSAPSPPAMHEEFGLAYERRWLERFGLAYYGCCEPLHRQDRRSWQSIPNLRKISISPWADVGPRPSGCEGRYVMSLKPSPSSWRQRASTEGRCGRS